MSQLWQQFANSVSGIGIYLQGFVLLLVLCPSLPVLPALLYRRLRHGRERASLRHQLLYRPGFGIHAFNVLLFAAWIGWLTYNWSHCSGGGCGSGIQLIFGVMVSWSLAIAGYALMLLK
jgi:hypothetical protein